MISSISPRRARQRGGVLVQALIVIAGLLALMASLAATQRVSVNAAVGRLRERRAEAAARSALSVAQATLLAVDIDRVTLADSWATLGETGQTAYELTDDATFRIEILDASSRINVNTAPEEQITGLPLTPEQSASLLDWRETATASTRTSGAKDSYYNGLTRPYNARLGRFSALSELLLVRDWTAKTLTEPQTDVVSTAGELTDEDGNRLPLIDLLTVESGAPNTRADDGSVRVNINQANLNPAALAQFGLIGPVAAQIVANGPIQNFATLLAEPGLNPAASQLLLDGVTFTATTRLEGRINISTASQAVLQTIPGMTQDIAAAIVARQGSGFQSLGELSTIPGLTGQLLGRVADVCGVGSDTFLIRARGESGGFGVSIEALVGLRDGVVKVLSYERLATPAVPAWWRWDDDALNNAPVTSVANSTGGGASPTSGTNP